MRKTFLLFILSIWGVITSSAQLYRYLDKEDGLSSRRVISIEKDTKGYMWFLTHEGVDRYNGKQYIHYKLQDNENTFQHFPNLSYIHVDNDGDIWILNKNGRIFKYNSYSDNYDLVLNFVDSIPTNRRLPLTHIRMDQEKRLWLCTRNAQYIYDTAHQNLTRLESSIEEEITYLCQQSADEFFVATNYKVYSARLNGNKLSVEAIPALEDFPIIQHLFYHEPTHSLLIGTMSNGFYHYSLDDKSLQNIGNLKDVTINSVIPNQASTEEVLIATDGNGVYRLNMKTRALQAYLSANHQQWNKMNGDIIKDIYQDKEGRTWMSVFPIGITVYSEQYPTYECLKNVQETPNSLTSNQITNLIEDSEGDIWITTSNGVYLFISRTRQWKRFLSSDQGNGQDQNYVFISLCEVEPGVVLVGGYMSGMYKINKKNMKLDYVSPQSVGYKNIRPDKYIRSIYRDKEGLIWAGGYYNFKCINPKSKQIEHYNMDYPITFITAKNEKELWIGTINGLYKFNKEQKKIKQVSFSSDMGSINTIYQTDHGVTYIGTHGTGLWRYNSQTTQLDNFQTDNCALLSNNIFCILPSNHPNELIISTDNELVCYNTKDHTFLNWTKEQGLPTDNFNTSAGLKTSKGVLAFGSDNGLIIIRDSIRLPRNFPSKLVFSDFHIQYKQMKPNMEESPLTKPIDETESLTLSHDQNIFSLEVSSINYDCPSRILYSWKLEGFYDEWTIPSTLNQIHYTGLNPGEYTLKIRAILLDNGHTLEERQLKIIIEPPFSQSAWAWAFYTIVLVMILWAVARYLWMRKDSQISKEKIDFFIHSAHDIRTPLTLIKGPLSEISRTEELSEQGMNNLRAAILNTDRLSDMATKLIDFQKEEMYTSRVHVHPCELNQYIQNFLSQFQTYAQKKHLTLEFKGTSDPLEAWIDSNKIDSILHNLVSNALKYTPEEGYVYIELQQGHNDWYLTISDTGIGIPAADQKKMFKHLFRGKNAVNQHITGAGIGMIYTYRLVKRHFGHISMTSKENMGTTFQLRFPIDHKEYIRKENNTESESTAIVAEDCFTGNITQAPEHAPLLLIVEDNPDLRRFLHQSLSEHYRIEEAENGKEALDFIAKQQPDLVISDIMMPEMRGDEMCQQLKSQMETSHIPIILLTALGDRESVLHGLEIKADSYVVKPFDMDILKANIASILANKEFLRQRFAKLDYKTEDLPKEVKEAPGLNLDQAFLMKATNLIKKNLGKEFNVDDLCQEMGMSRSSLYNKIKALTDHSPSDFVRQIRMTEAATLLKSKKYTVAEVSDMMGYSDPKYFTDIFKKHYGMTPSAYMKQP